ncbi:MAG: GYF domain-containing protein [Polyangiaceae bacterium]|nr:GYF domain-containing protein [Polyangiaceae bacterium]
MTLAIHCIGCNKAFNIPPDIYERRVAGKIVTLKCKQCGNPIRIDARDEATKAAEQGIAQPEVAKAEVPKPEVPKPEAAKPEAAKPEAVAAKKPWVNTAGKQATDAKSSKATNPAIPAVAFKTTTKLAEKPPQVAPKPAEKAAPKPTATVAKPAAPATVAKPAATATAAKPAEPFVSAKKTSLGLPLREPLTPAATKPTQLASPKVTTERAPTPFAQSSYRRPTPAASPSAIRASRPPPDPDPDPLPQVARTPEPQAKKAPPPAPQRAAQAAKPVAAPPPDPIEQVPSVPPPPSSGPPLESLWAVDLPGSDAELPNDKLIAAIQEGRVSGETLVWRIGMSDWQSVKSLDVLRAHLPPPPPPPPPPKESALPWMEEPAAVPFEDEDDFDDEPTVAFQNPAAVFESREKPKPPPLAAASPKVAPAPPPARPHAVSEESITRTQTDIFGHVAQQAVPESQDALRALNALRTLNADHRPMSAPAPLPSASVTTARTPSAVAQAAPIESIRPDFRASGKKKLVFAALTVLVVAGAVAAIRLNSSSEESAPSTLPTPAEVTTPIATGKVDGAGKVDRAELKRGTPPPSPEVTRNPDTTDTPPPDAPATDPKPPADTKPGANDFLSAFSQAAGKADLGARAPKRFDPADALRAVKARVPFAKHCAAAKGVQGTAQIAVSFAPDGRAVNVQITGEGLNEIRRCLNDAMLGARMPAFTGTTSAANLTLSL